ncbi:MAG: DASH family cryptochrome [Planctomycetota bacterium]
MHHLVWLRNDLRLHDHEPITRACQQASNDGGAVSFVYVVDPHWFAKTRCGFDRMAAFRAKFLRESLIDLDNSLRHLGGTLLVADGDTKRCVTELAGRGSCQRVYCSSSPAPEEKQIERQLRKTLHRQGVELSVSPPNTLYAPDELPFSVRELPEVFSQFRRKVESRVDVPAPIAPPNAIPGAESFQLPEGVFEISDPRFRQLQALHPDMPPVDQRKAIDFVGGESRGLSRIDEYFFENDRLRVYKETRNGMLGPNYSSKLSPWLAHGCLSPRKVYELVRRYEQERVKNESTYWLIFELLWRDYFSFILSKHGARLFKVGGLRELDLPWKTDQQRFDAWRNGLTGYPLIDANMRELSATGFMSNRGRQNVASFLTKNLGIDWRMGAEWFESLLIDYDPASNYGNWNYTAGIGNDARAFRWFNTVKQATTYDRQGNYVRHWLPELAGVPDQHVHTPWKMHSAEQSRSKCVIGVHYPEPIVDLFKSADHNEQIYSRA